jgi:5-methylcytosine-specific restriction endonuclease McrA
MQGMGISSRSWVLLMASALKDNGSTHTWRKLRLKILHRDGYSCQMCGAEGNHVDHIIPRHAFGEGNADIEDNLQTLCKNCNLSKGGRFFSTHATPLTLPGFVSPQKHSKGSNTPPNASVSHDND